MKKIKLKSLVWDEWNVGHIKKHNLDPKQVEEVIIRVAVYKKGYSERLMVIGRSGKRIISVILSKEEKGGYYILTARDADKKERKLVYEKEKNSEI